MASRNRVDLIGRIGSDPEIRYTGSGDAVCNFRVATTETWKDKATGERKESTDWHRIVLFGKVAEVAKQYGTKGREVAIEGKLKTRKWQDKDGKDQYTTEVQVHDFAGFMLLGQKPAAPAQSNGGGAPDQSQESKGNKPNSFDFDEPGEIPF